MKDLVLSKDAVVSDGHWSLFVYSVYQKDYLCYEVYI